MDIEGKLIEKINYHKELDKKLNKEKEEYNEKIDKFKTELDKLNINSEKSITEIIKKISNEIKINEYFLNDVNKDIEHNLKKLAEYRFSLKNILLEYFNNLEKLNKNEKNIEKKD